MPFIRELKVNNVSDLRRFIAVIFRLIDSPSCYSALYTASEPPSSVCPVMTSLTSPGCWRGTSLPGPPPPGVTGSGGGRQG